MPGLAHVAVLVDPAMSISGPALHEMQGVAPGLGVQLHALRVHDVGELEETFAAIHRGTLRPRRPSGVGGEYPQSPHPAAWQRAASRRYGNGAMPWSMAACWPMDRIGLACGGTPPPMWTSFSKGPSQATCRWSGTEVRAGDQPQDRGSARPHYSADAALPG